MYVVVSNHGSQICNSNHKIVRVYDLLLPLRSCITWKLQYQWIVSDLRCKSQLAWERQVSRCSPTRINTSLKLDTSPLTFLTAAVLFIDSTYLVATLLAGDASHEVDVTHGGASHILAVPCGGSSSHGLHDAPHRTMHVALPCGSS